MHDSSESVANCRFYVQIASVTEAVFTEVSGLQIEMEVMEYQEGGNNGFVHRLPGRTKVGNITLKRGLTKTNQLYNWLLEVASGKLSRRHMSVIMYSPRGEELVRWNFNNAYPVKWSGPQFTADGKTVAIETIELAHDGLSMR